MSRAILLDAPASSRPADGDVITVSAVAEYACRRDGVPHRDLSAVASEDALAALQAAYWDEQLEWLRLLERRMVEASPSLAATEIRPIAACAYLLKLLLDNVFVRGFESAALTAGEWTEISHHVRPGGPPLLGEVLPIFCESRGVAYSAVVASPAAQRRRPAPALSRTRTALSPALRAARHALGGVPRRSRAEPGAVRPLMLTGHYDSGDLLRRNAALGGRSLLLARGRVLDLRTPVPLLRGRVPEADDRSRREWHDVATELARDPQLLAWPASWFEGQLAPLVAERLRLWVQSTMPEVLTSALWFQELYRKDRVDVVVAPFLAHAPEIGAFSAAHAERRTKAVLIEHGDIAHAAPSWDLNLLAADVIVLPTRELAEYLRERGSRYPERTAETVIGSYRWPRYAHLADRGRGRRSAGAPAVELGRFDPEKPTLVYLVTALASDSRYLNNAWYPDAWYFGLQAAIVEELERHGRFNVVVKLFPPSEHDASPLAELVAQRAAHVMVSREPFSDWIPVADRVIADMASTGLYEALVAGRPSMGLLWRNHPARPGAIEALGAALQPFSTHAEAAVAAGRFAAEPAPQALRLKPEGRDVLDSLSSLVAGARAATSG